MKKENTRIYFDNAATTPVDERVVEAMMPFFSEKFGNPSSLHSFGQEALFAVDDAREKVANFLNCKEKEVSFLSSATEANNLAILGILKKVDDPHVIVPPFEHKAVLEPVKESGAEIDHLPVSKEGVVKKEKLREMIKENTVLVSVGYANSEIGTLQPVEEIGEIIREENEKRGKRVVFHTDAVQAVNFFSCDVQKLNVDLLTMSGHKIYGPKGVAALYIREVTKLFPLMYGASQEKGMKPCTENVPGIVGLGVAVDLLKENDVRKMREMRDKLWEGIKNNVPDVRLNGSKEKRLPHNLNLSFKGAEGESIMMALDKEGIAVSTGSACASDSLSPSHVLLSIGLSHEEAHGSVRITLGRFTKEREVDQLLEKLPPIVEKLRKISGK